jgi:hypothetical protein
MNKKRVVFVLVILAGVLSLRVFAQTAEDLGGVWMNEQRSRKAEFYIKDGAYFGRLVYVADGAKGQVGDIVFKDLKWKNSRFDGIVLTPRGEIPCFVSFEGKDRIKIVAKKSLMSKTVYWSRAGEK